MRKSISLLPCLWLLTGCAVDDVDDLPTDIGDVEQAYLSSATLAQGWGATVEVYTSGGARFTATVLSEHWLLTVAHAEDYFPDPDLWISATSAGVKQYVYKGPVDYYADPDWDGGATHDLALIFLKGKAINFPARAKVYSGSTNPWAAGSQQISWMEGYGRGPTNCSTGSGILRGLAKFTSGDSTHAYFTPYLSCDGDSGGPWGYKQLPSSGPDFIQYAVNHGKSNWHPGGYRSLAAVIRPGLPFIESTMNSRSAPGGISISSGTLGGYAYRAYTENTAVGTLEDGTGTWCLDATGSTAGSPIVVNPCNGSYSQLWLLYKNGDLHPYAYSWMCAAAGSVWYNAELRLQTCNGSDAQLFRHDASALHMAAAFWLCVDREDSVTPGSRAFLSTCENDAGHTWLY